MISKAQALIVSADGDAVSLRQSCRATASVAGGTPRIAASESRPASVNELICAGWMFVSRVSSATRAHRNSVGSLTPTESARALAAVNVLHLTKRSVGVATPCDKRTAARSGPITINDARTECAAGGATDASGGAMI